MKQTQETIASETIAAVKAQSSQKETFRVKLQEFPEPWAIELNTKLNKFPLNERGSFVNANGKIVDVFGDEIVSKTNGGRYIKSKKRNRASKKRNGRKYSLKNKHK